MSGVLHLPRQGLGTTDVFFGNNSPTGVNWQTWQKPPAATFLQIITIGSGGGGGSGFSSATTNARGGGGGGGSGGYTYVMIPAFRVPDVLYVYVGASGGRATDAAGLNGAGSFVCIAPAGVAAYTICGALGGNGGGRGTAAAAGTAGGAAGAFAIGSMIQMGGTFTALAGQAGGLGGAHTGANAPNVTYPTTGLFLSGGAGGGGGGTGAGAVVLSPASQTGVLTLFTSPTIALAGDPAEIGRAGVNRWPLISSGGNGGGANTTGTNPGAPGGDGGFGSGGGGGGAGNGSNTGGAGGSGVVVICAI